MKVGGKTGTAETGQGTSHSWFIGFAGKDPNKPQYAIAALVEEGGEGTRVALPLAKKVLQAALEQMTPLNELVEHTLGVTGNLRS